MPPRISLARDDGTVYTDRERMLLDEEAHAEELQMLDAVRQERIRGVGLAAFICALHDALVMDESQEPVPGHEDQTGRFSREEILVLVGKALTGR